MNSKCYMIFLWAINLLCVFSLWAVLLVGINTPNVPGAGFGPAIILLNLSIYVYLPIAIIDAIFISFYLARKLSEDKTIKSIGNAKQVGYFMALIIVLIILYATSRFLIPVLVFWKEYIYFGIMGVFKQLSAALAAINSSF